MAKTSKTNPISSSPDCSVISLRSQRLASRKRGTEHAKAKSTRAKSSRATSRPGESAVIAEGTSGATATFGSGATSTHARPGETAASDEGTSGAKSMRATSRPGKTAAIDKGTSGEKSTCETSWWLGETAEIDEGTSGAIDRAAINGHGRDMPSLLRVSDNLLGSEPRYPTRRNRTPAIAPPAVVHRASPSRRDIASGNGILSPIVDSPPFEKRVTSTYANDLNYSDEDDNDFLLDDDDINDDTLEIEYMDTKKTSGGNRRGNLILGGPPQQDTSKMTESEKRQYRIGIFVRSRLMM